MFAQNKHELAQNKHEKNTRQGVRTRLKKKLGSERVNVHRNLDTQAFSFFASIRERPARLGSNLCPWAQQNNPFATEPLRWVRLRREVKGCMTRITVPVITLILLL